MSCNTTICPQGGDVVQSILHILFRLNKLHLLNNVTFLGNVPSEEFYTFFFNQSLIIPIFEQISLIKIYCFIPHRVMDILLFLIF